MGMHLLERLKFLEVGLVMVAASLDPENTASYKDSAAEISGRLQERFETLAVVTNAAKRYPNR